jgi:hypothetical protein
MPISLTAEQLLAVIERRLAEISRLQHALAVERAHLQQHTGPLRLGVMSPDAVLVHLSAHQVRLTGVEVKPESVRSRVPLARAVDGRPRAPARHATWRERAPVADASA